MLGIHHHLHAGVIDDKFFVFDLGELRRHRPDRSQEQPVRKLHDVGFVNGMNLFSTVVFCIFKGKFRDPRGGPLGDDLEALHHAGNDLVLEA